MLEKTAKRCAYCGRSDVKLTREHIWPDFIKKVLPTYQTHLSKASGWKPHKNSPAVRDVCGKCNNGFLSDLDNYGKALFANYFKTIVPLSSGPIIFEYDYHMLLRWLLKISYNDARTYGAAVRGHKLLIPYISGEQTSPPFPTNLLCYLIKESYLSEEKKYFYPQVNRMGMPTYSPIPPEPLIICKFVSFNSFYFQILSWSEGTSRASRRRWLSGLMKTDGSVLLTPIKKSIMVSHGTMDILRMLNSSSYL